MPIFDRALNEVLPDNYDDFLYKETYCPSLPLGAFVDNYIVLTNKMLLDSSGWLILPDTKSYLICYEYTNFNKREWKAVFVGPRSKAIEIKQKGRKTTIIIPFKLDGSYPFIKIPLKEFANIAVDLSLIYKHETITLTESLSSANGHFQYINAVETFLNKHFQNNRPIGHVHGITQITGLSDGTLKAKDLALKAGFGERHLLEIIKKNIGLSTKKMLRVNRLLSSLTFIDKAKYDNHWVNIACKAGYYDQSAMIDDFSEMLLCTPAAFLNRFKNT